MSSASDHLLEARLCAVGGQGIILGSEILAHAAIFHQGLHAIQSPTYGSQVRGGPTKVDVIIDDKDILYPKARNIKFFMAIAQSSFSKFWYNVADDALVLLDSNLVTHVTEEQRVAFLLNKVEGKKHAEIAELLGVTRKVVEYRIYSAFNILKKELEAFKIK